MDDDTKNVDNNGTTLWVDAETKRRLALIADAYERSQVAQMRYWVNREYETLTSLKLLVDPTRKQA